MMFGAPQGSKSMTSLVQPMLTQGRIMQMNNNAYEDYADDTQLYIVLSKSNAELIITD